MNVLVTGGAGYSVLDMVKAFNEANGLELAEKEPCWLWKINRIPDFRLEIRKSFRSSV